MSTTTTDSITTTDSARTTDSATATDGARTADNTTTTDGGGTSNATTTDGARATDGARTTNNTTTSASATTSATTTDNATTTDITTITGNAKRTEVTTDNTTTSATTPDGITDVPHASPPSSSKDVPPCTRPGLAATLRAVWHRWREFLRKAGGLFTVALAWCALGACDRGASSASPGDQVTSCPPAPGSISLAWSLAGSNGQPVSCATAGARSVALRLRSRSGGPPVFTAFPCSDAQGVANVPPDLYDVAIELHDTNGERLATVPEQTALAVAAGRTKPLAPVRFTVDRGGGTPSGGVLLTLQAQGVTFNCQPPASNGADITTNTITLIASDHGCAPVTFIRTDGGAQIGTYKINCSSPAIATCIESSEILTSPDLAPGTYVMHVRGKQGPFDCWAADSTLVVPPVGQPPLRQRIFLQRQPGC